LFSSSLRLVFALASIGGGLGALAALRANRRERERKAFVALAEAGGVENYRVDQSPAGKVLLRIDANGDHYRVGNIPEEVFVLREDQVAPPKSAE
jgi:hypothetical protein